MRDYPGIYVCECVATGKKYVGSSIKVKARIKTHKANLAKGIHINKYLQYAWNKYGAEGFKWTVVERNPKERFVAEQAWIEKLKSWNRKYGFNCSYPVRTNEPHPEASRKLKKHWQDPAKRKVWEAGLLKGSQKVSELFVSDPAFAKQMSEIRQTQHGPKQRKAISDKAKKRRKDDPEYRARHDYYLAEGRERLRELRQDPAFVANQVRGIVSRWKDPAARAAQAARMKALWDNPEFKAKQIEKAIKQINAYNVARARHSPNNGK